MNKYLQSPKDRGEADYYYNHSPFPHYYDSYNKKEFNLTPEEIKEYREGYDDYERNNIQKDWD